MKSAAVAASAASKITSASGLPSSPRNSWTMTLFGIFGCLNRRVASSHCPGRTFSCVTKSMASLKAHQEPTLYNRAVRLSPAGVARFDRVDTDMDQMGLGHRGPEDLVGPPLSRISIDDETREGVEEREGEPRSEEHTSELQSPYDHV